MRVFTPCGWGSNKRQPLTVARLQPDTRYLVAEMGARGIGHIAYLCRIAPPQVGVELNVGHAYVERELLARPALLAPLEHERGARPVGLRDGEIELTHGGARRLEGGIGPGLG